MDVHVYVYVNTTSLFDKFIGEPFAPMLLCCSNRAGGCIAVLLVPLCYLRHTSRVHGQVVVLTHEKASVEETMPYASYAFAPIPVVGIYGRSYKAEPQCRTEESVYYGWKDIVTHVHEIFVCVVSLSPHTWCRIPFDAFDCLCFMCSTIFVFVLFPNQSMDADCITVNMIYEFKQETEKYFFRRYRTMTVSESLSP